MADDRRHYDEGQRRSDSGPEGEWPHPTMQSQHRGGPGLGNDERRDRFPYGGERNGGSRGAGPRHVRETAGHYPRALGSYRTDDRRYHDWNRGERHLESYRDRDEARDETSWNRPRYPSRHNAADEYFRAAREQRDDLMRYEAKSPGAEFEEPPPHGGAPSWSQRERGGYWRQYEARAPFAGRGPKDYRRSDDRVREEVCDCMTDDPMLDASEITVQVSEGVVTLSGTVMSRDQKRRAEDVAERISGVTDVANQLRVSREANGHAHTAARPVTQSEAGTPSKSSSTTT
jgi:hypothetical protein